MDQVWLLLVAEGAKVRERKFSLSGETLCGYDLASVEGFPSSEKPR
jgi:hypothetical protein